MWRSGNGRRPGAERLLRQPDHDRGVLADRIEEHRVLELGDDLAQDVDALGLELAQVRQPVGRGGGGGRGGSAHGSIGENARDGAGKVNEGLTY